MLQLHQNGSGRTMLNGSPHGTFSLPQSLTKQSIGRFAVCLCLVALLVGALLFRLSDTVSLAADAIWRRSQLG